MPYLVRHTTPLVEPGICYGQANLALPASFRHEAAEVSGQLPAHITQLYYSPLLRCSELAFFINSHHTVAEMIAVPDLMEMHFGKWEMVAWDDINPTELQPWMDNFDTVVVPGGESFEVLYQRVSQWWQQTAPLMQQDVVIVAHAGTIRSLLSFVHKSPLCKAFELYKMAYGQVIVV